MGVPTLEVGYSPAMPRREDHTCGGTGKEKKNSKEYAASIFRVREDYTGDRDYMVL